MSTTLLYLQGQTHDQPVQGQYRGACEGCSSRFLLQQALCGSGHMVMHAHKAACLALHEGQDTWDALCYPVRCSPCHHMVCTLC